MRIKKPARTMRVLDALLGVVLLCSMITESDRITSLIGSCDGVLDKDLWHNCEVINEMGEQSINDWLRRIRRIAEQQDTWAYLEERKKAVTLVHALNNIATKSGGEKEGYLSDADRRVAESIRSLSSAIRALIHSADAQFRWGPNPI